MKNVIGHTDNPEFRQDLEIIARGLPGKGAALGRMIELAESSQQDVADHLEVDNSTVSYWVAEKKWPKARRVLAVLTFLNVDSSLLAEASAILFGGDSAKELLKDVSRAAGLNTFQVTKEALIEVLKGETDFVQRDLIFKTMVPQATLAVALRAAGAKGGESCDPKAAKLLFDEWRLHQDEARLREPNSSAPSAPNYAALWSAGHVHKVPPPAPDAEETEDGAESEESE